MHGSGMRRAMAVVSAVTLGTLIACATDGDVAQGEEETSLTVGVVYPPDSMDPHRSNWGGQYASFLYPVYDTLIRQNPDGTFVPNLAESWEYVDPQTFELTLREDAVFTDGTSVDAEAVKANLDRIAELTGPRTARLEQVESVEALDEYSVRVNLSSPHPSLPLEFSQTLGMMVNPDAFDNGDLGTSPVGSGPYVLDLDQTVTDSRYTYIRNPDYWNQDDFEFDELIVEVYPEQNSMLNALRSGQVGLGYGNPDTVNAAEEAGLEVAAEPINLFMIFLSDRSGEMVPEFQDVRVRQALNYAIDRDAILNTVYVGEGQATSQLFPPGSEGYSSELDDAYEYNPETARELLADAGVEDGFDFDVALPAASRDNSYAQAIAGYLSEVGVTMNIDTLPPGSLTHEVVSQYPAYISAMGITDTFSDSKLMLMPPATHLNPFGSENADFVALWEEGSASEDDAARQASYAELGERVVEEAWFVPTTLLNAIYFYDPEQVRNVEFTNGVSVPQLFGWSSP